LRYYTGTCLEGLRNTTKYSGYLHHYANSLDKTNVNAFLVKCGEHVEKLHENLLLLFHRVLAAHAVTYFVAALCYKPEDRGLDSR
jgi:hypothetical protein